MRVLVTGATGFIGNHVVRHLVMQTSHTVIATGRNIQHFQSIDWRDQVRFIEYDIGRLAESPDDDLFKFFGSPDLVIHLAWDDYRNIHSMHHLEQNLFSSYFFLKNLIGHGLRNVSVIGSGFEYGLQNGVLSEDAEARPVTPYAIAKNELRVFLQMLASHMDFRLKWIRVFHVHGPGQHPGSLHGLLDAALARGDEVFNMSGGEQLRDYLPVEKAGEYVVKISLQNKVFGIINCCSGYSISIRRLVEEYLRSRNAAMCLNLGYYPYSAFEPMAAWGDNSRLNRALAENEEG